MYCFDVCGLQIWLIVVFFCCCEAATVLMGTCCVSSFVIGSSCHRLWVSVWSLKGSICRVDEVVDVMSFSLVLSVLAFNYVTYWLRSRVMIGLVCCHILQESINIHMSL